MDLPLKRNDGLAVRFSDLVSAELTRARAGHPNQTSDHEAYAVLLEEVDEFWDEVKKKRSLRDPKKMLAELVQIAAMAQRSAEDLGLMEHAD